VGKPEGKRPLERPRRRWLKNIKMDLGETEWGDMDWKGCTTSGLSSSAQLHREMK
jgi:hypothetical protein